MFPREIKEEIKKTYDLLRTFVHEGTEISVPRPGEAPVRINGMNFRFAGSNVKIGVLDKGWPEEYDALLVDMDEEEDDFTGCGLHDDVLHAAEIFEILHTIAPDAEITAERVIDASGQSSVGAFNAAIERLVQKEVDIINVSLASPYIAEDDSTRATIEWAYREGKTIVMSAGNSNLSGQGKYSVFFPATMKEVTTVGAVRPSDSGGFLVGDSGRGSREYPTKPDVVAVASATSPAAAYISAMYANILSLCKLLNLKVGVDSLREILKAGADDDIQVSDVRESEKAFAIGDGLANIARSMYFCGIEGIQKHRSELLVMSPVTKDSSVQSEEAKSSGGRHRKAAAPLAVEADRKPTRKESVRKWFGMISKWFGMILVPFAFVFRTARDIATARSAVDIMRVSSLLYLGFAVLIGLLDLYVLSRISIKLLRHFLRASLILIAILIILSEQASQKVESSIRLGNVTSLDDSPERPGGEPPVLSPQPHSHRRAASEHVRQGSGLLRNGDYERARALFQEALELSVPDEKDASTGLALSEMGLWIEDLRKTIPGKWGEPSVDHLTEAEEAWHGMDTRLANITTEDDLFLSVRRALRANLDDIRSRIAQVHTSWYQSHVEQGRSYLVSGDYGSAKASFQEALKLSVPDKRDAKAGMSLSEIGLQIEELEKAIPDKVEDESTLAEVGQATKRYERMELLLSTVSTKDDRLLLVNSALRSDMVELKRRIAGVCAAGAWEKAYPEKLRRECLNKGRAFFEEYCDWKEIEVHITLGM